MTKQYEEEYIQDNGFGKRVYHCGNCNSHKLIRVHVGGFMPCNWFCEECFKTTGAPKWTLLKETMTTAEQLNLFKKHFPSLNIEDASWGNDEADSLYFTKGKYKFYIYLPNEVFTEYQLVIQDENDDEYAREEVKEFSRLRLFLAVVEKQKGELKLEHKLNLLKL